MKIPKKKKGLQNERRQRNDINATAGPRGIERVKVEAPCETAGKVSRQQREGGRGREKEGKKERGLTAVIYVSRHEGFQPLIT